MKTTITTAVLAIAVSLAAAACGSSTPDPAASPTTTATVDAMTTTMPLARSLLTEPTGPAAIGVRTVPSVSPDATARLWYPAVAGTGSGEPPYISADTAASVGLALGMFRDIRLRATLDASPEPTAMPRPGIILMPGAVHRWPGTRRSRRTLASNGYVVLSIEPTPGTQNPNNLPLDLANPARRLELLSSALDFITGPKVAALAGPVDATRIAAGGHSIAGAVAIQVSLTDPRISAVFNLDGWLHGPALEAPVEAPALLDRPRRQSQRTVRWSA